MTICSRMDSSTRNENALGESRANVPELLRDVMEISKMHTIDSEILEESVEYAFGEHIDLPKKRRLNQSPRRVPFFDSSNFPPNFTPVDSFLYTSRAHIQSFRISTHAKDYEYLSKEICFSKERKRVTKTFCEVCMEDRLPEELRKLKNRDFQLIFSAVWIHTGRWNVAETKKLYDETGNCRKEWNRKFRMCRKHLIDTGDELMAILRDKLLQTRIQMILFTMRAIHSKAFLDFANQCREFAGKYNPWEEIESDYEYPTGKEHEELTVVRECDYEAAKSLVKLRRGKI
uniref:Lin-15A/B-like domain-containing protein n=1 Tax=Caenorhabditis japonica TaxID=281687 RepID=A0A8R1EP85_CAEJA